MEREHIFPAPSIGWAPERPRTCLASGSPFQFSCEAHTKKGPPKIWWEHSDFCDPHSSTAQSPVILLNSVRWIPLKALLTYYSLEKHQESGMCSPYFTHSKANKQENLPVVITQWYMQDQEQDVSSLLWLKMWQPSPRQIILTVLSDPNLQNPRREMQENDKVFFQLTLKSKTKFQRIFTP